MNEIWFPIRIQSGIESRSNFYFLPGDMLVPKSNILREMKEVLENSKKFYNDYPNEENKMTVESIEKTISAIQHLDEAKIVTFGISTLL